jgi:hypothetical protein
MKKDAIEAQRSEERSVVMLVASNEDEVELAWTPSCTAASGEGSTKKHLAGRSSLLEIDTTESTARSTGPSGDESSFVQELSSEDDDEEDGDDDATEEAEPDDESKSIQRYKSRSLGTRASRDFSSPVQEKDYGCEEKPVLKSRQRVQVLKARAVRVFRKTKPTEKMTEEVTSAKTSKGKVRSSRKEESSTRQEARLKSTAKVSNLAKESHRTKGAETKKAKARRSRSIEPVLKFAPKAKAHSDTLPVQRSTGERTSKTKAPISPSPKREPCTKKRALSCSKSPRRRTEYPQKPEHPSFKMKSSSSCGGRGSRPRGPLRRLG